MLFTDSVNLVTRASILAAQPEIEAVEAAESVRLASVMPVAWNRAAQWLRMRLYAGGGIVSDPHTAAVLAGVSSAGGLRVRLNRVCVCDQFREWYRAQVIVCFYEAVARRKNADRHAAKLEQAQEWLGVCEAALWAVQYVNSPLAVPGATQGPAVGIWGSANLSSIAGGANAQATYRVAVTWTGSAYVSQAARYNSESALSEAATFTLPAANRLAVSISGLVPPGSVVWQGGTVEGPWLEMTASGWNVWVGDGAGNGPLYLQNVVPIAIGTTSYTLAADPVLSGSAAHDGQVADGALTISQALLRG